MNTHLMGVINLSLIFTIMIMHRGYTEPTHLTLDLWDGPPPSVLENATYGELYKGLKTRKVGIPQLTLHFPDGKGLNRPVFLLCPGGGYRQLARVSTGNGAIERLLPKGAVVAVLSYRTRPPYGDKVDAIALSDAKRSVRLLRKHAGKWGLNPNRVAVIGWSAGGNLTLNLTSHADEGNPESDDPVEKMSSRPNIVAMLCPWPYQYTIERYPIPANAPPAFIASAGDDKIAPTGFAEAIVAAYKKQDIPVYFWQIDTGGHMAFSETATGEGRSWEKYFWNWLTTNYSGWERSG